MLLPSQVTITKLHHFTGHSAGIYCLAQGLTPQSILSSGGDGIIALWQLDKVENAIAVASVDGNIFSMLLSDDRQFMYAGDLHGNLHVMDLQKKAEIERFTFEGGAIYSIVKLADNQMMIGAGNGNAYIIDGNKLQIVKEIVVSDKAVRCIRFSAKRQEWIFACSDFNIYVYDCNTMLLKHVLNGHDNSVFTIAFNVDETKLVSGSRDAQIRVWDVQNDYACLLTIPAHMYTINDIVFSPDGKLMATAGRDKHIKIWDAATFHLLKVIDLEKFSGHINSVNKLFWSNWNNYLISCGDDRTVMVWDISIKN